MRAHVMRFTPINLGRWVIWGFTALLFVALPLVFDQLFARSLMAQMGIMIIFALSYNMLLGQSGMLSFGHAVYSGLGAYFAIHLLIWVGRGQMWFPVSLLPLVAGLAGMGFGVLFGYLTTKKAGTPFAMISLGLGELVFQAAQMFPGFFGGEAGVSGNRTVGGPLFGVTGWTLGPDVQVVYLIAVWTFVCMVAMFALTQTPLGRMANAVRDNPERAEFIGYYTQHVRYFAFMIAGFFSGIAGGLGALNFEIVTAEVVGAARSGAYLLFTFLGGATFFFGPIIGRILMILASVLLSELTKAWLLYLGLVFLFMVMYAPGGMASLIMMNLRVASFGHLRRLWVAYVGLGVLAVIALLSAGAWIEMVYHLQLNSALGPTLKFAGMTLDALSVRSWFGAGFVLVTALGLFELARRQYRRDWDEIQVQIEQEIKRREAL